MMPFLMSYFTKCKIYLEFHAVLENVGNDGFWRGFIKVDDKVFQTLNPASNLFTNLVLR